ncbi:hypothetical protein LG634_04650 [Streptomyces bambusae]|uniref:hypothetical protein n=1 Tax=Streptomyces bambusae TaxID=1550616 RepID=UPI001CFE882C|nr:hypothetical protein [Streptomyces bambusae]MCB5164125.1 hypothetical protein [Streptomyces bambusae]
MTWPDPDAYVLVDGVMLRMSVRSPGPAAPGTRVQVQWDPRQGALVARAADGTGRAGS